MKGIQEGGDQQQAANNLNNNIKNASSLMANSDAIGADGLPVGNKMVLDRKAQLELEEKQRQEELREIRNEIETLATTCKFPSLFHVLTIISPPYPLSLSSL